MKISLFYSILYWETKEGRHKVEITDVNDAIRAATLSEIISFETMWLDLSRYKNHLLVIRQIVLGAGRAYECEELTKHST